MVANGRPKEPGHSLTTVVPAQGYERDRGFEKTRRSDTLGVGDHTDTLLSPLRRTTVKPNARTS